MMAMGELIFGRVRVDSGGGETVLVYESGVEGAVGALGRVPDESEWEADYELERLFGADAVAGKECLGDVKDALRAARAARVCDG